MRTGREPAPLHSTATGPDQPLHLHPLHPEAPTERQCLLLHLHSCLMTITGQWKAQFLHTTLPGREDVAPVGEPEGGPAAPDFWGTTGEGRSIGRPVVLGGR